MALGVGNRIWPALSLLAALMLAAAPVPGWFTAFRPEWVPVVLLCWSLVAPERFGMLTAVGMGLALDVLTGALLGQHALALLLVVYLCQRFQPRIRVIPLAQLTLMIVMLLALYESVLFWVDGIADRTVPFVERWAPILSSTVVWLIVLTVLDRWRRVAHARI